MDIGTLESDVKKTPEQIKVADLWKGYEHGMIAHDTWCEGPEQIMVYGCMDVYGCLRARKGFFLYK